MTPDAYRECVAALRVIHDHIYDHLRDHPSDACERIAFSGWNLLDLALDWCHPNTKHTED